MIMSRIRHFLTFSLCLCCICAYLSPVCADVPEAYTHSTLQREVYMPNGAGPFRYYAQNDPIWRRSIYEAFRSNAKRLFGDGGCNPTALAIVVASLVPSEHLALLADHAAEGRDFLLCSCSVNKYYCQLRYKDPTHTSSTLTTNQDFLAVLPLAFGDYATGNNPERKRYRVSATGGNGGTSHNMFEPIAAIYGLSYRMTKDIEDVYATLDRGGMVIALCSGVSQIFSGSNGHYVVIGSHDEEYLYIMDPFVRDEYKKDRRKVIEPIDTGIKKIMKVNLNRVGFGSYALFEAAPASFYADDAK